jgi:type II secretory pathway pseudopilin PulG
MKRTPHGETGFSLLETLLGLTLTAMIGVLMMGSLQMGTRVWERQKAGALPGEEQLMLGQTSEWLAQAMPARLRSVDTAPFAPFFGNANRASFIYSAPGLGASPGVYAVDLALMEADGCEGGRRLMMRIQRILPADDPEARQSSAPQTRELAGCLTAPSFAFWGTLTGQPEASWHEDWQNQAKLPSVARLRSMSREGVEQIVLTQRLLNAQF